MTMNLKHKFGKGLQPEQFVQGMTRNQDKFQDWYNRFEWTHEDDKAFFTALARKQVPLRCVIIAADWCGDVVRNVPVVFRVVETAQIPTDVLVMEEHLEVIDQFLVMGGRSIPVVLFVTPEGEVLAKWGPRPQHVQEPMVRFKRENPDKTAPDYEENLKAARAEIMKRYGEDTGYQEDIVREIRGILEGFTVKHV